MTPAEALRRNNILRRPCGCRIQSAREIPWNIRTAFKAWLHGRSFANHDGFLTDESWGY